MAFGNVNVKFSPCKAVGQLKSAAAYILGKRPDQIRSGIKKTEPHLYNTFGCDRDNFANNVLVTRKLNGKSYSRLNPDTILAHKLAISFHPDDNDRLTYELAYKIARQFANEFSTKRAFRCCSRCTPTHSIYTRIFWSATAICRRENHFVAEEKSFSRCPNISGSSAKPTGLYTQSARIFTALPNAELRLNHR